MKWMHKNGFSLIELMIVLAIIAIIAMLAGTSRLLFTDVATPVWSLISYMQYVTMRNAMLWQAIRYKLSRLIVPSKYLSFRDGKKNLCQVFSLALFKAQKDHLGQTQSSLNRLLLPQEHITFYPDGIMQSGTIYLVNDKKPLCMH